MPFGSRGKGKNGEREVAKLLQVWWRQLEPECEFASTPLSGGWNKASIRGGMKLSGDLCTTAERFPFVVEVKRREKWDWHRLVRGLKSPVWGWWEQCKKAALEQGGEPILIFRKNREEWLCMMRDSAHGMRLSGFVVEHNDETVIVGELKDLLNWEPSAFAKVSLP